MKLADAIFCCVRHIASIKGTQHLLYRGVTKSSWASPQTCSIYDTVVLLCGIGVLGPFL